MTEPTQNEADELLALTKIQEDETERDFPNMGGRVEVPLVSPNKREQFVLTVRRRNMELRRYTDQLRARQVIVLARLDVMAAPHRNPDGQEIGPTHLHLYREGWGDKWAFDVPSTGFSNLADAWATLQDFMSYCHIEAVRLRRGLPL